MKHLLINPPCYCYNVEAAPEYSLALMRLSTYLGARGDEVEMFDFLPYKTFYTRPVKINGGNDFKLMAPRNEEDAELRCYKSQKFPLSAMSFNRRTGEYVSRLGKYFQRVYSGADRNMFKDYLAKNKPDRIWMSSGITYYYKGTVDAINWCKEVWPNVPVVLGGVYPTLCYEHAIKNTKADQVVKGDFKELEGLDCDFTVLPNEPAYILRQFSRGCPNKCGFCSVAYVDGVKVRTVDIDKDIAEISRFSDTYNNTKIKLWGSNMLLPNRGKDFERWLDGLIALGKKWEIACPEGFAPELLTESLCKKIRQVGFAYIQIPLESGGEFNLSTMNKHYTVDVWKRAVETAYKAGFSRGEVWSAVICGYGGQTEQDLVTSLKLIDSAGVVSICRPYTPVPMSEWYERSPVFKNMDLEYLNDRLIPAANTVEEIELYSRFDDVFRNGYTDVNGTQRQAILRPKKEEDVDKSIISKMATLLVDIAEQNEEILKGQKEIKRGLQSLEDRIEKVEKGEAIAA